MSFFKAKDFDNFCGRDDVVESVLAEWIATAANAKRDEVREILEDELLKVRAELKRYELEFRQLRDENQGLRAALEFIPIAQSEAWLSDWYGMGGDYPCCSRSTGIGRREMIKLPEGIGFTGGDTIERRVPCDHCGNFATTNVLPLKTANAKLPALFQSWVKREGVKVFSDDERFWSEEQKELDIRRAYVVLMTKVRK